MLERLGMSAVNPALLWGTLLVAAPILIHLLNKRRFKIVDWAAMDFLLDANRQNRRRVRIEELLLLLLRCLAILLLAMIVARLVFTRGLMGSKIGAVRVERIVLLDDSPSMGARGEKKAAFEEAKDGLVAFVRGLGQDRPGDSFTLLTTSDPERPLINAQYATPDKVEEWAALIGKLELSDLSAHVDKALLAVEQSIGSRSGNVNRVLYVVTDLRNRDWLAGAAANQSPVTGVIQRLRPRLEGMVLIDVGNARSSNLTVAGVSPLDKTIVAGVPAKFEVLVRNFSDTDLADVDVTFTAGGAAPLRASVPSVKANSTQSIPFTFTFSEPGAAQVAAEIGADDLPADNSRFFAADVRDGVQVLLVDGEPSSEFGQAESFFLERALAPIGNIKSGNTVQVVTENQFEGMSLENFQAVVICNLYRLSEDRIAALEAFANAGGGVIFFLGDQVDEAAYNSTRMHKDGAGIFPVKLAGIAGDETERQWVHLAPRALNHPILRVYEGANNPFVGQVKIFRYWRAALPAGDNRAAVLATLTSPQGEPLIVEKPYGNGRVIVVTTACDGEWSTWPADASFVVSSLEMASHVARSTGADRQLPLGSPLKHVLDVSKFEPLVGLAPPNKEKATQLRGVATEDGRGLLVEFDDTRQKGFYQIAASRRDGKAESITYAANIDPEEGDLRRADPGELRRRLKDVSVDIVSGADQLRPGGSVGGKGEMWRGLLIALMAVLCAEQLLGWHFGRNR